MKTNKFLTLHILIILFLSSCSTTTPDIIRQTSQDRIVVGMGDEIKAWRDNRGIFYYLGENGNKSYEPVYLSKETCNPKPQRRSNFGVLGIFIIPFMAIYDLSSKNSDGEKRAIEMQCTERLAWEQGNRYRPRARRNYYRR